MTFVTKYLGSSFFIRSEINLRLLLKAFSGMTAWQSRNEIILSNLTVLNLNVYTSG